MVLKLLGKCHRPGGIVIDHLPVVDRQIVDFHPPGAGTDAGSGFIGIDTSVIRSGWPSFIANGQYDSKNQYKKQLP